MKRSVLFKLLAGVLILCMLAFAFAGCKNTDTSENGEGEETADATGDTTTDAVYEQGTTVAAKDAEDDEVEITGDFTVTTSNGTVTQSGSVYTISAAGEYTLSGALADGQVYVNAGDDDKVTLILAGVSITCSTDSPIYIKNADKVTIKASEGTYNVIKDTRALQTDENDTTGSAAIYACCDLDLAGKGSLVVSATYNNGIHTKDDLEIKNLTLKVTAPNNAIKGNDSLTVLSGEIIAISTAGDALKTSNSDISSKGNQRGTVTISGGTLNLYAGCDGIDAAYDVVISGEANITIRTNSYSAYTIDSLKTTKTSSSNRMAPGGESGNTSKSAESSKGIKADNQITVSGGTIEIYCKDDGLHANSDNALENGAAPLGNVTISGGSVTVTAADDGIHADGTLLIEGGYINVIDSYEGLEGHYITVKDGEIHVFATDDGVNATGSSKYTSDGLITVNGGKLYVECTGRDVDGIDANGSYKQTGGFVVVSNPNANSQGTAAAVDVDGSVSVTGGIIVALGTVPSSGSGGGPGGGRFGMGGMSASSVPSDAVTFSGTLAAGTHTFTYGGTSYTFTLKNKVSSGWIWASGISSSNYTLK